MRSPRSPPPVLADYPNPPSTDPLSLDPHQQLLLVARHSPCLADNCTCRGWKPRSSKSTSTDCTRCGHDLDHHGMQEVDGLDEEEKERRIKVASRIDELLNDEGKLFDFDYTNEDIESLKKQMTIPAESFPDSTLAENMGIAHSPEANGRPLKRARTSSRSPASQDHDANGTLVHDTIHTLGADQDEDIEYTEKPAVLEEREGVIEFRVVNNDNTKENMIILTGLKNIFQKQLPKMPREYIARLIYDRNHLSMAIVKKPLQVVGGITYRPFNHRKFAEIVFCAITSSEQVKGYGSHLMNHLKDYVKGSSPIQHFLTYADNYAIGYFKKQGFTKEITLDKPIWMGYIKDYEGGTLMQCSMLPKVRYLDAGRMLALQKAVIMRRIKQLTHSDVVHPALDVEPGVPIDPFSIPGIKESGWTPEMDELARRPKRVPHFAAMQMILTEMQNHAAAWPFLHPVNREEVPDYYTVVQEPMDLSTMDHKLDNDQYTTPDEFVRDAKLIFNNCRAYNGETTTYYKNANRLEKFFMQKLKDTPEFFANLSST